MRRRRCAWGEGDPLYQNYHDEEWGVPIHDDRKLFEFLVLEGMQAGLSWHIILKKRENFRAAFDNFNPEKVAAYGEKKIDQLLRNEGIIRNRMKIESSIQNAKAFCEVQREYGSFDSFIWQFVGGKPKRNAWETLHDIPAKTRESEAMSRALKNLGFTFVGSTICYAFMQAVGMVNDHVMDCFRYDEIG